MHSNEVGGSVRECACPTEPDWDAGLEELLSSPPPEDFDWARDPWDGVLDEARVPAAPELAAVAAGAGLAWLLEEAEVAGHARFPDDALPVLVAAAAARLRGTWASSVELAATAALTERARGWRGVDPGERPADHSTGQPLTTPRRTRQPPTPTWTPTRRSSTC